MNFAWLQDRSQRELIEKIIEQHEAIGIIVADIELWNYDEAIERWNKQTSLFDNWF